MSNFVQKLRKQPAWIAAIISVLLILWVISGSLAEDPSTTNDNQAEKQVISKVKAKRFDAELIDKEVSIYGRTEPDRQALLKAEIKAQVVAVLVERGMSVKQGQKLVLLAQNDVPEQLAYARSLLVQRELEYQGIKSLNQKEYQAQTALAQAEANLHAAKAQLAQLQLALSRTTIVAPFDGILNERFVEVGDALREGDQIAQIVDLQPLVIRANVTEAHIADLKVDQKATARLISGEQVVGHVRYVASVSNSGTNTFPIEIAVDNPQNRLMAGLSSEVFIGLKQDWAIKITPALMALDEDGSLGVKVVEKKKVRFVPIDILKSERDGVWLAGLGQQATVITVGHGFVRDGDDVDVIIEE
ncbi:efflux RND transporter periplasmic adaptor subunit [Alteromonadaceae bacterium BrNp21-10]|nr:efflux RND transporter periplasmic adaptor subunit [Alteromonadaceae bacterium BrNp21-10]